MIFHAISFNSLQQLPKVSKIISGLVFTEEKTITLPKVIQLLMAELRCKPLAIGFQAPCQSGQISWKELPQT